MCSNTVENKKHKEEKVNAQRKAWNDDRNGKDLSKKDGANAAACVGTTGIERGYCGGSIHVHSRNLANKYYGRGQSTEESLRGNSGSSDIRVIHAGLVTGTMETFLSEPCLPKYSNNSRIGLRQWGGDGMVEPQLDDNVLVEQVQKLPPDALLSKNDRKTIQLSVGASGGPTSQGTSKGDRWDYDSTKNDSNKKTYLYPSRASTRQRDTMDGPYPFRVDGTENGSNVFLETSDVYDDSGNASNQWWSPIVAPWDRFFHSNTGTQGCRLAGMFRICYALQVLANFGLFGLDMVKFLSPTQGLIPQDTGAHPYMFSIMHVLPEHDASLWICYFVFLIQTVLLGLGVGYPRFQAFCVYMWHSSFHATNTIIWDGEDSVFRVLGLLLIFFPLNTCTIYDNFGRNKEPINGSVDGDENTLTWPMWPFRLAQIEMCLIYITTGIIKLAGEKWVNGTALYNVVHLDDVYGNLFNPKFLFGYYGTTRVMTYIALVIELVAPVLLWIPKYRMPALATVVLFHVGMGLAMNLNLFQPIMILGWLVFLIQPDQHEKNRATENKSTGTLMQAFEDRRRLKDTISELNRLLRETEKTIALSTDPDPDWNTKKIE